MAVNGQSFVVQVNEGGDLTGIKPLGGAAHATSHAAPLPAGGGEPQKAPLAGNIFKVLVQPGQHVEKDELIIVLEAMKMETDIRAIKAGIVGTVNVKVGDTVAVGDSLLTIG
ncbi:Glutaconyl-CoA decarboxylase subunit gamma [compost metagenome]